VNLFPQSLPLPVVSLKTINGSIPVYRADGSLFCTANEDRLARLQSVGLVARVVRSRKGDVKRAILFVGPSEPSPILVGGLGGTRYSFREHLESGYYVWTHKRLRPAEVPPGGARSEPTGTGA
jgi:hypothetical protein